MSKLVDNRIEEAETMATCSKCLKEGKFRSILSLLSTTVAHLSTLTAQLKRRRRGWGGVGCGGRDIAFSERPDDKDEMLMCDGCNLEIHVSCAGLSAVPDGDWLCASCLDVLDARRKSLIAAVAVVDAGGGSHNRSLAAKLPRRPHVYEPTLVEMGANARRRFREEMLSRRNVALRVLEENQGVLAVASRERVAELMNDVPTALATVEVEKASYKIAVARTLARHGE